MITQNQGRKTSRVEVCSNIMMSRWIYKKYIWTLWYISYYFLSLYKTRTGWSWTKTTWETEKPILMFQLNLVILAIWSWLGFRSAVTPVMRSIRTPGSPLETSLCLFVFLPGISDWNTTAHSSWLLEIFTLEVFSTPLPGQAGGRRRDTSIKVDLVSLWRCGDLIMCGSGLTSRTDQDSPSLVPPLNIIPNMI